MNLSVLISVYAKEKPDNLKVSLQSLVEQTQKADEVVLVEDGHIPENLTSVIEDFRDELNIKSVKLAQNRGLAIALNEGLNHCQHPLVARMDTDDACLPQRFEKQMAWFQDHPELDVIGCFATEIDEEGHPGSLRKMPVTHGAILDNLWTCPLIHPTIMFRRDKILLVGAYDLTLRRRQE